MLVLGFSGTTHVDICHEINVAVQLAIALEIIDKIKTNVGYLHTKIKKTCARVGLCFNVFLHVTVQHQSLAIDVKNKTIQSFYSCAYFTLE